MSRAVSPRPVCQLGFSAPVYTELGPPLPAARSDPVLKLPLMIAAVHAVVDPPAAQEFLREIRQALRPGDALLLGADLKKDRVILERAYDDPTGVTAAFNRNLLGRINRELGGHFDLDSFRHRAFYNDVLSRVEVHLVSTKQQEVPVDQIGFVARFAEGESIHTESAHKFDADSIASLARTSGFGVAGSWTDAQRRFADFLLTAQ